MRASRSMSAPMLQFPISPSSRLCKGRLSFSRLSFELGRQLPQPFQEFTGPSDAIRRIRLAGTDLDRNAAARVDEKESVLVGHVVTRKDRAPAGERFLVEIVGDRRALVAADGLCFDNHLAALEFNPRQFGNRLLHQRDTLPFEF